MLDTVEKTIIDLRDQLTVRPIFVASNCRPPSVTWTMADKQKLYYNNLGVRLDCAACGTPLPDIAWLRTNGSATDRSLTPVQPSALMSDTPNRACSMLAHTDILLATSLPTGVSSFGRSKMTQKLFMLVPSSVERPTPLAVSRHCPFN
jgi:hypothetical protein